MFTQRLRTLTFQLGANSCWHLTWDHRLSFK